MSVRRRRRLALTAASLVAAASLALGTASATASTPPVFWAWGDNTHRQLGNGTTNSPVTSPQSVAEPVGATFTSLAAGLRHACGLTAAGAAYCWGENSAGQVGNSTVAYYPSPVAVSGGWTFTTLTAGNGHSCGLTAAGAAYCWGVNDDGQLGNNTTSNSSTPVPVTMPSGVTFTSLSAGGQHSCGLTAAGAAYCWGDNPLGQLGNGTTADSLSPVAVTMPSGVTFSAVTAGDRHSCATTSADAAYCWGYNHLGQLGNGTTADSLSPVAVTMPSGVTFSVVTAGALQSCGLTTAGAAYCWGFNLGGELGDGTNTDSATPVRVAMPSGVTFSAMTTGHFHSCGLTTAGATYCWGQNFRGQLGNGTTTNAPAPQLVPGGLAFSALAIGETSTYGLPLRPASGDDVPRAALQQFARTQAGTCEAQPDDLADFPALTAVRHQQWAPSWAQWPNSGTGGYVCTRQPYYTSIGTWAVQ